MIQAAIIAVMLLGLFKVIDRNRDPKIDEWEAIVIGAAPAMIAWVIALVIGMLGLPEYLNLFGFLAYLVAPYLILTKQFEYPSKRAIFYSAFVPVVAIVSEVIIGFGIVYINNA